MSERTIFTEVHVRTVQWLHTCVRLGMGGVLSPFNLSTFPSLSPLPSLLRTEAFPSDVRTVLQPRR